MTNLDKAREQGKLLQQAFFDKALEIFGEESTRESLAAMHVALTAAAQAVGSNMREEWPTREACEAWLNSEE